jgi:hypothetical protein
VTEAAWESCNDPEVMVCALVGDRCQRELRLFGVACARPVWPLLPDACRAALLASERFADGEITESELAATVNAGDQEAREAFPSCSAPDARAYAVSAAIDASLVWPRTASNVLAATSCAASATACAAAEADAGHYDEVYSLARRAELAAQADLLRSLVRFSAR